MLKYLITIPYILGFKILPYEFEEKVIKYSLCDSIDERIATMVHDVFDDYNSLGFNTIALTNDTFYDVIPICNEYMSRDKYGYARFINKGYYVDRKIFISNYILDLEYNLWNVLYHEILHTVGLGHSTEEGLMKYVVTLNTNYDVIPDTERVYPSTDDIEALEFLYGWIREEKDDDVIIDPKDKLERTKNNKKIIKKLYKLCMSLE